MGLKGETFFDTAAFGVVRFLPGFGTPSLGLTYPPEILAQIPISDMARKDLARLQETQVDYLPGLSGEEKRRKLRKTSYKDFLLQYVKVDPEVVKVFQSAPHGLYAVGIDAVSALDCVEMDYPGFKGMKLESHEDSPEQAEPYIFHFPDGNASIARLLVRSLVPGAIPGHTMDDIVTARADYSRLDDASSPVRIRLNSTAVNVAHVGPAHGVSAHSGKQVEIAYDRGGKLQSVRAEHCILACYNVMIPYICPELPEAQRKGLSYLVKSPLIYTHVAISNWTRFHRV